MFNWFRNLFKEPEFVETEMAFTELPIGQKFKKNGDERVYLKTNSSHYQTTDNGWHCPHWFLATEDFNIRTVG